MSDYEKINAKVKANVSANRGVAVKVIVKELVKLLVSLAIVIGLHSIGFINGAFMIILVTGLLLTGAFKAGQISRDIKF
jgi:hypothetical protein